MQWVAVGWLDFGGCLVAVRVGVIYTGWLLLGRFRCGGVGLGFWGGFVYVGFGKCRVLRDYLPGRL